MTDIVVEITENNTQVTVSEPDVIVVTDLPPAASAAASAAAAAAAVTAVLAGIGTALAAGTYPASFTTLAASDNVVIAATKKLYLDGVAGVGGDSYIVESSANVVDHYAGGTNVLKLTASAITAVVGTINVPKLTNLTFGDTYGEAGNALSIKSGATTVLSMTSIDGGFGGGNGYAGIRAALGIQGAAGSIYAPSFGFGAEQGLGLYRPAAATLGFVTSNTEWMRITATGFIGVGTADPSYPLHVKSAAGAANYVVAESPTGYNNGFLGKHTGGTWAGGMVANAGTIYFYNAALANIRFAIGDGGNVGVGSTAKLYLDGTTLNGNTYIVESSADVMSFYAGGTNPLQIISKGVTANWPISITNQYAGVSGGANKQAFIVSHYDDHSDSAVDIQYGANIVLYKRGTANVSIERGIYSMLMAYSAASSGTVSQAYVFDAASQIVEGSTVTFADFRGLNVSLAKGTTGAYGTTHGVRVNDISAGGTNYGIYLDLPTKASTWNIYANGTANNYLAGNLGVGTSAPGFMGLAGPAVTINGATGGVLEFGRAGVSHGYLRADTSAMVARAYLQPFYIETQGAYDLILRANTTEYLRVTSGGNVVAAATSKLYLDGVAGAGGDSYIVESSANVLDLYAGGTKTLSLTTGGAAIIGTISTTDPAGGAGPAWKLGVAASVSPTAPDRTLRVDVGGTSYYLAAKTTND